MKSEMQLGTAHILNFDTQKTLFLYQTVKMVIMGINYNKILIYPLLMFYKVT